MKKPGPKVKDVYYCLCCDPPNQFSNSRKKCDHERNIRNKKSKTDIGSVIGDRDTKLEDVLGTSSLKTPKKIFMLGDTGAFSKFK
jgi:hypothetical protein